MKIGFVRAVDYYIGIPICFLLSIINKLSFLLFWKRSAEPTAPRKVLFIELSEMGSTVIAYSAMKRLKERLDSPDFYFVIFERNRESVDLLSIVPDDHVLTIRDDSFMVFVIDIIKVWRFLRKTGIDASVDLELFSRFSAILSFVSGARKKVGFYPYTCEGLYRGNLQTHNVFYNTHVHMVYNFCALCDALLEEGTQDMLLKRTVDDYTPCLPEVTFDNDMLEKYSELFDNGKKVLVVNPHAGDLLPLRNWGLDRFAEVTRRAIEELDVNVVLVGLASARRHSEYIAKQIEDDSCLQNLTGETRSIFELLHVLANGDVLLTNDSGPAHFASLTKIRNIVLFGPETDQLYGPLSDRTVALNARFLCSPCLTARNHRNSCCQDNRCLQSITVDQVVEEIDRQLTVAQT